MYNTATTTFYFFQGNHEQSNPNKPLRLRVGKFNVHQFSDGNSKFTFDGICDLLRDADLDIVGLQEATGHLLPKLIRALGKDQYKLAAKFGGVSLMTRLPLVSAPSNPDKGRYCCGDILLPDSSGPFSVAVLHLDHRKEESRMHQLKTMVQSLDKHGLPLFDIWMGDFNALTPNDYTKDEWANITTVRRQNSWERPAPDVTFAVSSTVPTKKNKLALGLQDAFASSTRKSGPLATSRFDTRIDYVFFQEERLAAAGWFLVDCEHFDSKKLSDHNLVVATFEKPLTSETTEGMGWEQLN